MRRFVLLIMALLAASIVCGQEEKEIVVEPGDRYLNFPVNRAQEHRMARVVVDGQVFDEFTLRLAGDDPDYWSFLDVSRFEGKTLTVEVDGASAGSEVLENVHAASRFPGQDSLYNEKYRQQVHFSSRRGWNNDPNGLVYYKGQYHLYYQHNPFGWNWGNMHWGHAVSTDLIHWRELPNALFTSDHDHMAFSGSGFIADQNTSGFSRDGIDPLVAAYTRTGKGESLALSYDSGRTFQDYRGNPVVEHRGRDPKIFWYEPGRHWVMVVYDESQTHQMASDQEAVVYQHAIYTSDDLKQWTYQSSVPGFFECPELFEIKVEGTSNSKWVMYGADGKYKVGSFNGKKFTPDQGLTRYQYGDNESFYASQTYNNAPEGRRIQIGWFKIETPGMPFNQCMTIPMELDLIRKDDRYILTPEPVEELEKLHKESYVYQDKMLRGEQSFQAPVEGNKLHVVAVFKPGDAHEVGLNINGYEWVYSHLRGNFNNTHYKIPYDGRLKIEVVVDRSSMEVFVNDGELYYAVPHNSVKSEKIIEAFAWSAEGDKALLKRLEIHKLKSIWKE